MSAGPNVETILTADQVDEDEPEVTLSAKDLRSRVKDQRVILDDGEQIIEISAEIGPHSEAREHLRDLAVNLLTLAEGLK